MIGVRSLAGAVLPNYFEDGLRKQIVPKKMPTLIPNIARFPQTAPLHPEIIDKVASVVEKLAIFAIGSPDIPRLRYPMLQTRLKRSKVCDCFTFFGPGVLRIGSLR